MQAKSEELKACERLIDEQHKMMLKGNEKLEKMTKKFVEAGRVNADALEKMNFQTDKIARLQKLTFAKNDEIRDLKLLLMPKSGNCHQIDSIDSSRSLNQRIEKNSNKVLRDKLELESHVMRSSSNGNKKAEVNKMIQTQFAEMSKRFSAPKTHNLNSTVPNADIDLVAIVEQVKSKLKLVKQILMFC